MLCAAAPEIWPKDNWIESRAADNVGQERHTSEFLTDMFEIKHPVCAGWRCLSSPKYQPTLEPIFRAFSKERSMAIRTS